MAQAKLDSGRWPWGCGTSPHPSVPFKSRAGNRITIAVFRLLLGMKVHDTQTGLRAIPRPYIPMLAGAKGDRYEYETNMLFLMNHRHVPFVEVPITVVYLEGNRSSHFRVVRDSLRVYGVILSICSAPWGPAWWTSWLFPAEVSGGPGFPAHPTTFTRRLPGPGGLLPAELLGQRQPGL